METPSLNHQDPNKKSNVSTLMNNTITNNNNGNKPSQKIDIKDEYKQQKRSISPFNIDKKRLISQNLNKFFIIKKHTKLKSEKKLNLTDMQHNEDKECLILDENDLKSNKQYEHERLSNTFRDNSNNNNIKKSSPHDREGISRLEQTTKVLAIDPRKVNIMNPKILESWINETILEVERQDAKKIDILVTSEKRTPLRNYGIDRQSLEAIGLTKEKIDRLYRSLFVYSAGFFELISSIFDHTVKKFNLIGSVWKVYWILLEYCYKADHQTILEEIQKDNIDVVQKLHIELESKKKELKNIEESKEKVLTALTEELNKVKMEKENLLREKIHLEEENKISDKAYSEEVQLRIKFENKINEIYAIHRDLKAKHDRTILELINLQKERETDTLAMTEIKNEFSALQHKNLELIFSSKNLVEKISSKDIYVEEQLKLIIDLETKLSESIRLNEEIETKKRQYEYQDINFKARTYSIINDSLKQNVSQLQKLLEKAINDKTLYENVINDMKNQLNEESALIMTLELSNIQIKHELSNKIDECKYLTSELEKLKEEKEIVDNLNIQYRINLDTQLQRINQLIYERDNNIEMMKNMNKSYAEAADMLKKSEEKVANMMKELEERDAKIATLADLKDKLNENMEHLQKKTSTLLIYNLELENELKYSKNDLEKYKQEVKEQMENEKIELEKLLVKYRTQTRNTEGLNIKVMELEDKYKTEVFLKNSLTIKVEEMKRVFDIERIARMELSKENARLEKQREIDERDLTKYKKLYEMEKDARLHQADEIISHYDNTLTKLTKIEYPMIYEDLWSHLREFDEKNKLLQEELASLRAYHNNMKSELTKNNLNGSDYKALYINEREKSSIFEKKSIEAQSLNEVLRNKNYALFREINDLKDKIKQLKKKLNQKFYNDPLLPIELDEKYNFNKNKIMKDNNNNDPNDYNISSNDGNDNAKSKSRNRNSTINDMNNIYCDNCGHNTNEIKDNGKLDSAYTNRSKHNGDNDNNKNTSSGRAKYNNEGKGNLTENTTHNKQSQRLIKGKGSPSKIQATFYDDYENRTIFASLLNEINKITTDENQFSNLDNPSKLLLLHNNQREIQSDNDHDMLYNKEYIENPLRLDQFLIEDGKLKNVDQIIKLAAKLILYGIQRKGIEFIPESRVISQFTNINPHNHNISQVNLDDIPLNEDDINNKDDNQMISQYDMKTMDDKSTKSNKNDNIKEENRLRSNGKDSYRDEKNNVKAKGQDLLYEDLIKQNPLSKNTPKLSRKNRRMSEQKSINYLNSEGYKTIGNVAEPTDDLNKSSYELRNKMGIDENNRPKSVLPDINTYRGKT